MMLRRRRTYGGSSRQVTERYGYFMKNCEGNSTDEFSNVFLDLGGNYSNPVYLQYGADRKTGEFPLSLVSSFKTFDGAQIYLQKSYSDGSTIVLAMGKDIYISYNGGSTWTKLFTMSYSYTGSKRMLFGQFVYFNSSYIFVLFSTSPSGSSTIGYNTTLLLMCCIYTRSSGSIKYKLITTLPSETVKCLLGSSTLMSPDGIVCLRLDTYWSGGDSMVIDTSGNIKFITVHLPAVAATSTMSNCFKRNSYKVVQTVNTGNTTNWGFLEESNVWVYDGSTYGAFLDSSEIYHYGESVYRNNIFRLAISATASKLSSVTLSSINSTTGSSNRCLFLISEHCTKNVNNQILVFLNNGNVTVRNATTWALVQSLGTLMDFGLLIYGTKYPTELGWYADDFYPDMEDYSNDLLHGGMGVNITPDGKYFVMFSLAGYSTGAVIFIRRADYAVMVKSKFLDYGINRNLRYVKYMIPRVTLDGSSSGSGTDPVVPDPDPPTSDTINLNSLWQVSSLTYSSGYAVYESFSNHNVASSSAVMYFTPGSNKTIYIRSDGESTYDYTTISNGSSQIASTSGNLNSWVSASLTAGTLYTITYKKDGSVNNGEDRGYVAILGTAKSVSVNLNSLWKASSSTLSGYTVWESYSNKGTNSSNAYCIITISGYTSFTFKVRNYSESNYDYVTVNNLDDTSSAWNSNVYYTNYGKSSSSTWYDVTFSGITDGQHLIKVNYGKDGSLSTNDDCGYLAIANSYL